VFPVIRSLSTTHKKYKCGTFGVHGLPSGGVVPEMIEEGLFDRVIGHLEYDETLSRREEQV
jgi:hypothetical protein